MRKNKTYLSISKISNNLFSIAGRAGHWIQSVWQKSWTSAVLFVLILLIGVFARLWQYRELPPGLNQDEASIGVEAYDLLHYGMDRNGISDPVFFISWGSGQNALYAYLLIPFIYLFGISPFIVRLPMLISGILSMPLMYWIGDRLLGRNCGLLAMFLLAIAPWHILLSRWGLESNILPFVFLIGFACLLKSIEIRIWFIPACIAFALCLYAYGTAYAAVPLFLSAAVILLVLGKHFDFRFIFFGLLFAAVISLPIGAFVVINSSKLGSIHIGPMTIPRLPVEARFINVAATSSSNFIEAIARNTWSMLKLLLFTQSDGMLWNVADPFGYLYVFSFPLALIGAVLLFTVRNARNATGNLLLLAWLIASLSIGVIQSANINRLNLVFLPIILCTAVCMYWLGQNSKIVLVTLIGIFLFSFIAFNVTYHGSNYKANANVDFYAGLIPALDHARQAGNQPICVTDRVNMPYIFVLFSEKPNPAAFLGTIDYIDPSASFRQVRSMERYYFGLVNCPADPSMIYVLADEKLPDNGIQYTDTIFTQFHVYSP